ncbi:TetR family transcriptional regulator [Cryptosporangium phraense]|uniref:Helix-turn-helix transcriptional regulator n=1 Tax=Cryptosporangium phraense TaxID=2593070 RepID=A0A545AMP6_9ACTN|nr:TetR family transcriptional regulator [Cryptosporangium phraense]TQS42598.1 helix-turn-helix transcriptional regulator [Cryptosporangium phraense]
MAEPAEPEAAGLGAAGPEAAGPRPRGRRPGSPDTRAAVLAAARAAFAEHGYKKATIRGIARSAGVDPALVIQYFTNKEELFRASLELVIGPREHLDASFRATEGTLGFRLASFYFGLWETPGVRESLTAMALSAASEPEAQRAVRALMSGRFIGPIGAVIGAEEAARRVPLCATQMLGMAFLRYVLPTDPMASLPVEDVIRLVAPVLDRYLTDDLDDCLSAPLVPLR